MNKTICFLFIFFFVGFGCRNSFKLEQHAFYDLNYGEVGLLISEMEWVDLSRLDSTIILEIQNKIDNDDIDSVFKKSITNALGVEIKHRFIGYLQDSLNNTLSALVKQKKYRYFLFYEPDVIFYPKKNSVIEWFENNSTLYLYTSKGYLLAKVENRSKSRLYSDSAMILSANQDAATMLQKIKSNPFPIEVNNWNPWNWHGASIKYDDSKNTENNQYEIVIYRDDQRFYGIAKNIFFQNNNTTRIQMPIRSYLRLFSSTNQLTFFNALDTINYKLEENKVNYFECKFPGSLKDIFIAPDANLKYIPSGWVEARQDAIVY